MTICPWYDNIIGMFIKDLYRAGRPVVSLEVFPPKKHDDIEGVYETLGKMAALSPDFISVTYGAGGSGNGNKTVEIASFIWEQLNILPLAHLTCIGSGSDAIAQKLDEAHKLGIRNMLALRGDLPEGQQLNGSYRYSEDLIRDIDKRGDFCIGAACYPEGHIDCQNIDDDIARLRRKQDAGADFLITQLFFENDTFFRFLETARASGVALPISAGVMPILGRSQIERMIFMCGASLPSGIIKLLHKYKDNPADLRKAGVEYAAKQVEGLLRGGADGVHIYTMNKADIAEHCMRHIGRIK